MDEGMTTTSDVIVDVAREMGAVAVAMILEDETPEVALRYAAEVTRIGHKYDLKGDRAAIAGVLCWLLLRARIEVKDLRDEA